MAGGYHPGGTACGASPPRCCCASRLPLATCHRSGRRAGLERTCPPVVLQGGASARSRAPRPHCHRPHCPCTALRLLLCSSLQTHDIPHQLHPSQPSTRHAAVPMDRGRVSGRARARTARAEPRARATFSPPALSLGEPLVAGKTVRVPAVTVIHAPGARRPVPGMCHGGM
jgi:hypothetical protein